MYSKGCTCEAQRDPAVKTATVARVRIQPTSRPGLIITSTLLLDFKNTKEHMNVLLLVRKNIQRSALSAMFLINTLNIQVACLILLSILDPFLLRAAELLLLAVSLDKFYTTNLILVNFVISMLLCVVGVLAVVTKSCTWFGNLMGTIIGSTIVVFKYLFLVPTLTINIRYSIQIDASHYKLIAAINILASIFISIIEMYANWSNRFLEKDYCNRRENSVLSFLLLASFVITQEFLGTLVGCIVLITYSVLNVIQQASYVEYSLIQKTTIFYAFFHIYLCVIALEQHFNSRITPVFQLLLSQIVLGLLVCSYTTHYTVNFMNHHQCNLATIFSYKQSLDDNDGNSSGGLNMQEKSKTGMKDLVILSKVLLSRMDVADGGTPSKSGQYELWWQSYNEILLLHSIGCALADCPCRLKYGDWKQQIIIMEMTSLLNNRLTENQKGMGMKMLSIYLYVQISKKPLKAYYEIMRFKRQKLSIPDSIDIQCLIEETRQCFDQIFLKNNVQNSGLPLLEVIEFEDIVQSMEMEIRSLIENTMSFLELFTLTSVKISQVMTDSQKLFRSKQHINRVLELLVLEYPDNNRVQMMIFVFFQFLEVYRSREKQFRIHSQEKMIKKRIFDKTDDDAFNPEYGVIYIDLIEQRGKIKKITKNVCKLFGYNIEDMISFNINQFMPRLYGKHHAKFLTNFIENGAIKILKEKKRFLFGKNKSKFVFPIIARLKTEHLFDREFGATGLVKSYETHSAYIIVGAKGKIEEVTENAFTKIFGPILKNEVDKVKRFTIYKMIPEFVNIINSPDFQPQTQRIYQSLLIFTREAGMALEKFKIYRELKKNGSSSSSPEASETSKSVSYSDFEQSTEIDNKQYDVNYEYCGDIFKHFLVDLNIFKLFFMKIHFKISKLKTNEFELMLIEILDFGNEEKDCEAIIAEYKKTANFLKIYEQKGPIEQNFNRYSNIVQKQDVIAFEFHEKVKDKPSKIEDFQHMKNKAKRTLKMIRFEDEAEEKSCIINDNFSQSAVNLFNEGEQNAAHLRGTSERSSVTDQTQNQSKKQMLINAFNSVSFGVSFRMGFCLVFSGLMMLMMILLSIWSIMGVQQMARLTISDNMVSNISQMYEYRLSLERIEQYYTLRQAMGVTISPTALTDLQQSQQKLTKMFTHKIQNIDDENKVINYVQKQISMYNTILHTTKNISLINLFNRLEFSFQNQGDAVTQNDLTTNYQTVHKRFSSLLVENSEFYIGKIKSANVIELVFFVVYEVFVMVIALIVIPLHSQAREKEKRIIGLLSTMNVREIKKAKMKLKILWDNFKLTKLGALNTTITALNQSGDDILENEPEKSVLRNIKLIYDDNNKQEISVSTLLILIAAFVLSFSMLSVLFYATVISSSATYSRTTHAVEASYHLQVKVPLFVNLYLINVNNILAGRSLLQFDAKLYEQSSQGFFALTDYISVLQGNGKSSTQEKKGLTNEICSMISCDSEQQTKDLQLGYHILDLKNKFDVLSSQQLNLAAMDQASLVVWADENGIDESLEWVSKLFDFSQKWNLQLITKVNQDLQKVNRDLSIMTGIFLPFYMIVLVIIAYKLIYKLNSIVNNAEHIHMHFPVPVLSENTYLTSYFNEKIKSNK